MQNRGKTAFMTAYLRGFHSLHDDPKILDDALAFKLLPDEVRQGIERHLAGTSSQMASGDVEKTSDFDAALGLGVRVMAGPILARARYVEDRLEEAVGKGVSQYVILGAGLDTFAFRRRDLADRVRVFELDLPVMQDTKIMLLARAGLFQPDYLTFVPVDLGEVSLVQALAGSDYDPGRKTFFSWTGVTHYLPVEAIHNTLRSIAGMSVSGSEVVFDYWDKSAFDPEKASNRVKSLIASTRSIGEPIITGLDSGALEAELSDLGLWLIENLGPDEIKQKYLSSCGGGYSASEHVHLARAVVK
ncbi:MAG: SAM-dependent methyltransferase [Syntrophomonadaceae bacterium]